MGDLTHIADGWSRWQRGPQEALRLLLRPAGGGIFTVSTGREQQVRLQEQIYGVSGEQEVVRRWHEDLARLPGARVLLLGVPSDVGAGFARGASFGPQGLRQALLGACPDLLRDPRLVDLGDVLVVPQLLEDEMLSEMQLRRTRRARYGDEEMPLPVSPLSAAEVALRAALSLAPHARPLLLGGDHSVSWPAVCALLPAGEPAQDVGILHLDAHTDLLAERLGVRYCFATWAYHANERIGRGGRLVQVGIRASTRERAHWESTLGVRQYWMEEVRARGVSEIGREIVAELRQRGVRRLYVSNDIDGTDPAFASATGTPEPGGLLPEEVCELVRAVGAAFTPLGADLTEVAPPLGRDSGEPARTLATAVRYLETMLALLLS
ncbi:MAG: arginase family protein [Myxococcota bacterium]|nr:arginase family protein [Myxococcota bacterium]